MSSTHPVPDPRPSPRGSALTVVMFLVGGILLLPGLCSLVFAIQIVDTDDVVRLATRDPYFQIVLMLWAICLLPAIGGVFLIRFAMRRNRAREN
jgi:hypothetical protein